MAGQSARIWCQKAVLLAALGLFEMPVGACTSAAWEASATLHKAPLLWKNRDTDSLVSRMVFVDDKPYKFVGLVDDSAPSGRMVYAGLNERGFAIFNTVAYNLPALPAKSTTLRARSWPMCCARALRWPTLNAI